MIEMAYVVKERSNNNYVNIRAFTLTSSGWLFSSFTGIDDGFTCYKNKSRAEEILNKLENISKKYNLGKSFYIEYINLNLIKKGHNIIEELTKQSLYI